MHIALGRAGGGREFLRDETWKAKDKRIINSFRVLVVYCRT